ncbi:MAG: MerR family transcriptional regulator, partial [Nitrospinales bacterium]
MVNKKDKYVSISELANQFSTSRDSIEIYGLNKLVSPKSKNPGGKVYGPLDRTRLKFIIHAKNADYSINNIRILIGELDVEKDEAEQIDQSIIYSKRKLDQMKSGLQDLSMLEQINMTCDIELLNAYINDLNQLKYGLNEIPSGDHWVGSGEIDKTKSKRLLYSKIISDEPVYVKTEQIKNGQKRTVPKFLYAIPAILIILISGYVFFDTPVVIEPELAETNAESTSTDNDNSFQLTNEDLSTTPTNKKSDIESIQENSKPPMDVQSPESEPQRLFATLNNKTSEDVVRNDSEEFSKEYDTKTTDEIETAKLSSKIKSQKNLEEDLFDRLVKDMSAKYDREADIQSTQEKIETA